MMNAGISARTRSIIFLAVIVIGVLVASQYLFASNEPSETRQVRWLLSHQPTDVFARAAEVFAQELSDRTDGRLVLDIVTPEEMGHSGTGDVPNADVLKYLSDGRVELATTYTVGLGQSVPALWSLNLPFLFRDYDSAGKILDGAGGANLLDTVEMSSDVHALAFTMSGGFRVLASKDPLRTPGDLKGKRVATSGGPVAEATLTALGAQPVSLDLESNQRTVDADSVDAVETTYSRLSTVLGSDSPFTKHIAQTNHSLFLTIILASDSFFESLSENDQKALREAAIVAARVEREDSEALGETTKAALEKRGTAVTTFSEGQRKAMQEATRSVYTTFESEYGTEFVQGLAQ